MGIGQVNEVETLVMSEEAIGRLLADVSAFDEDIFAELQQNHDHATAMKLMRDVHGLMQLGYPALLAISEAEAILQQRITGAAGSVI